jgi:CRISPR-associated protein Csd1
MLEQLPMPRDIVSYLSTHASRPMAYSKENREWVLSTACAVIVKYYIDKGIMKGEETVMKLDIENRDRSYLFGRLLAVLEKVERVTYKGEESREPNAIRLQSAYVNHPFQTWMILEEQLSPYFQKLKPKSREYYRGLISEITALFVEDNQQLLNQSLSEMYLLGYYLQRAELNKKKDEKEEVNNG